MGDLPLYSALSNADAGRHQTTFQQASRLWVVTDPGRVEPQGSTFFVATAEGLRPCYLPRSRPRALLHRIFRRGIGLLRAALGS